MMGCEADDGACQRRRKARPLKGPAFSRLRLRTASVSQPITLASSAGIRVNYWETRLVVRRASLQGPSEELGRKSEFSGRTNDICDGASLPSRVSFVPL